MKSDELSPLPQLTEDHLRSPRQRRRLLPAVLFIATCLSTFWVGAADFQPHLPEHIGSYAAIWQTISTQWQRGVTYMVAVLAILLTHEMGHFLQTIRYGIPASYPLCIPVPFNAIGTMGAVIGMDGLRANRREIFDIGIAGPLAGLVLAVPIMWLGVERLTLSGESQIGDLELYNPLVGQWMLAAIHPQWAGQAWIPLADVNPFFMAGWVGMLITGINMMPISQLDGGHTAYAVLLDRAYVLAKVFVTFSIVYIVLNLDEAVVWTPMLVLVILMGIHHPPTADDSVPIGRWRTLLGIASLAIPVFCFPLLGFRQ